MNKIFIPDSCEHTQPLRVLVEPPSDKMYIQLCDPETKNPFQSGKIEGRRGQEIAIFMFRPMKIVENDGKVEMQQHLKKGEQVLVCVQVFDNHGEKSEKAQIVETL